MSQHEFDKQGPGEPDGLERIWTPHRMAYVRSAVAGDGCPFCTIPGMPEDDSLILTRGQHCYAVLNLHPYNPGHLMVVPYRHVAGLEELSPDESAELMLLTQQAITVIRSVSNPHAFNVGINLGGAAGGSLSDHLHQHVVPRWSGDSNFITVVAGTKTLPQLLQDTQRLIGQAWSALT